MVQQFSSFDVASSLAQNNDVLDKKCEKMINDRKTYLILNLHFALKSPVVVNPSLVEDCGGESLATERGIHVCGLI